MADSLKASKDKLNLLYQTYVQQLRDKVGEIEVLGNQLLQGQWNHETLTTLHFKAHRLAGSSATFGFVSLSKTIRMLEILVKAAVEVGEVLTAEQRSQVNTLLAALRETPLKQDSIAPVSPFAFHTPAPSQTDSRLIFLVENDLDLAQDLALQIGYFGYTVRVFEQLAGLEEAVAQTPPGAIVMDVVFPEGNLAETESIARIQPVPLPVVFIAARDDLAARLQAVRAGGSAYFTKPIDVSRLMEQLDALTTCDTADRYRILIVDDDAPLAAYYALTLQQADITTVVVNDPMQIMQPLVEFKPDLILMDIYMSGCSGLELAAVIRQQEAYVGIPIIFLSSETSLDKQLTAIRLGGDDFLTKPIQPNQLIASVKPRVRRARILRSFMERDSLTGLLNHTKIREQLNTELQRASRQNANLVFAMLDIDCFKTVNDTYGHLTGDRVLKNLSRLLQQRLRKADTIGRHGGEEFAVILPDTDEAAALKVLDEIRRRFAQVRQQSDGREFAVTFSCGVATFPRYTDATRLSSAADRALYEAKRQGRNRIVLASNLAD